MGKEGLSCCRYIFLHGTLVYHKFIFVACRQAGFGIGSGVFCFIYWHCCVSVIWGVKGLNWTRSGEM